MRKCMAALIVSVLIVGAWASVAIAQRSVFIWGTIKWITGTPASGLEVQLVRVRDGAFRVRTFANQVGRYGFFDIEGQPAQYRLIILSGGVKLSEVDLAAVRVGGRVPDIQVR